MINYGLKFYCSIMLLLSAAAHGYSEPSLNETFKQIDRLKTSNPKANKQLLDQLEQKLDSLNEEARHNYYFFRAHELTLKGHFKKAEQLLQQVIDSAPLVKQQARAYSILSNIALYSGDYPKAFESAQMSLELLPEIKAPAEDDFRFAVLQNNASLFKQAGILGKSMEYSNQLLKYAGNDPVKICIANYEMANWDMQTSQLEMLGNRVKKSREACAKTNDELFIAFSSETEARFLMLSGNLKEAEKLMLQAAEGNDFNGYFLLPIIFNTTLASIYDKQKDSNKAIEYALKAYAVAKEYNDKTRLKECTQILATHYSEQGDLKSSVRFYREYLELEKQLELQTNQRKLAYFNMSLRD